MRTAAFLLIFTLFLGPVVLASGRAALLQPAQANAVRSSGNGSADLQVSTLMIVPSLSVFAPGSMVEYRIVLRHHGPDLAANVVLEDMLPPSMSFRAASPGCTLVTPNPLRDVVRCEWSSLPVWLSETTIWLQAVVQPEACGLVTNTVQISSDTQDPDLSNNSASLVSEIQPCDFVPVRIVQSMVSPPSGIVHSGDTVTFEIAVTNLSNSKPLTHVSLEGFYDSEHLQFFSASHGAETSVSPPVGKVVWADLTNPAPNGFGEPLLPQESFRVQISLRSTTTGSAWSCAQGEVEGESLHLVHTDCDNISISGLETATPIASPTGWAGQRKLYLPIISRRQAGGPATIFTDDFNHGTMAGWTPNNGTWSNRDGALRGEFIIGQAWDIYNTSGSDFVYEGNVTLIDGSAAGLTIRSSANGRSSYDITLDAVGKAFKISKQVQQPQAQVLASYPLNVERGQSYHIKVVADSGSLEGYLDGVRVLVANDGSYLSGRFGVTVYIGAATFDNLRASTLP